VVSEHSMHRLVYASCCRMNNDIVLTMIDVDD
jgi:hypothetical protein